MSKKKVILIIVGLLIVWTLIIKFVGIGITKFKNSFSLPKATSEEFYKIDSMEKEIASLKEQLAEEKQKNEALSDEEEVVEKQTDSEYVVILPYGTEIYQLGYDVYDIMCLSDYLSESNGYLTRRPYDYDDKDVWCPEDTAVIRERSTGKYKLIVFQGFGTRPE